MSENSSSAPTRDPERPSSANDDDASSSGGEDRAPAPALPQRKKKAKKQPATTTKKRPSKSKTGLPTGLPTDQLPVEAVASNAVDTVGNTLGSVAGKAGGGGGGGGDTLRLRLDLNLDIEITLKAKIHGDLELALLYVDLLPFLPLPSSSGSSSLTCRRAGQHRIASTSPHRRDSVANRWHSFLANTSAGTDQSLGSVLLDSFSSTRFPRLVFAFLLVWILSLLDTPPGDHQAHVFYLDSSPAGRPYGLLVSGGTWGQRDVMEGG